MFRSARWVQILLHPAIHAIFVEWLWQPDADRVAGGLLQQLHPFVGLGGIPAKRELPDVCTGN